MSRAVMPTTDNQHSSCLLVNWVLAIRRAALIGIACSVNREHGP